MNKQELINKLKEFKKSIQEFHYKRWHYTINIPPDVVENRIESKSEYSNHDLKENIKLRNAIYHVESRKISNERKKEVYDFDKSNLKQQYGKLSAYIQLFSGNPAINKFPCYDGYFLNDGYQGEEVNFPSVVSDIDIMIGKVDALDEKDFQRILKGNNKNTWRDYNPIWWIYLLSQILRKYKVGSLIIAFVLFMIGSFFTKSIEPIVDFLTKPMQHYFSGVTQNFIIK